MLLFLLLVTPTHEEPLGAFSPLICEQRKIWKTLAFNYGLGIQRRTWNIAHLPDIEPKMGFNIRYIVSRWGMIAVASALTFHYWVMTTMLSYLESSVKLLFYLKVYCSTNTVLYTNHCKLWRSQFINKQPLAKRWDLHDSGIGYFI